MAIWTKDSSAMTTSNNRVNYRVRVILNSQSVANNTSNVTVQVHVWRNNSGYTTYGTGTVYVNINGTNYSAGISSSQRFTYNSYTQVFSRTLNISHGSDGKKTLTTSARISHQQFSSSSQSYNPALNTIPRASSLSAFSFASNMKPSTAITINYTVDRKSSSFRHHIQLRDGSHVVQTWDNISSNGASAVTLSTASVNSLLNRLSSDTSRSLTLRVATRGGHNGGWIGSAVTRNATIYVDSSVKPSVGAVSVGQSGNSVSSHILQSVSKVTASFTRSGGYGATITSSSITIRRKSSNNDVQTINSNSGTSGRAVSLSGTYQARGMARDSRGRTTYTAWKDFAVTAYSPPSITKFTAIRKSTAQTTVDIVRSATFTSLGGSNTLTWNVQRRLGSGSWTNVNTRGSGTDTTGAITNATSISTGNSVTRSYEFRFHVKDKIGIEDSSVIAVSTQQVVLDVHKDLGVGIGKLHEQGVLDVGGPAHFSEGVAVPTSRFTASEPMTSHPEGLSYFVASGSATDGYPTGYFTGFNINPMSHRNAQLFFSNRGEKMFFRGYREDTGWSGFTEVAGIEYGSNSSGDWVRFSDGTQICWNTVHLTYKDPSHLELYWEYPVAFINDKTSGSFMRDTYWGGFGERLASPVIWHGSKNAQIRLWAPQGATWSTASKVRGTAFAIGRWK